MTQAFGRPRRKRLYGNRYAVCAKLRFSLVRLLQSRVIGTRWRRFLVRWLWSPSRPILYGSLLVYCAVFLIATHASRSAMVPRSLRTADSWSPPDPPILLANLARKEHPHPSIPLPTTKLSPARHTSHNHLQITPRGNFQRVIHPQDGVAYSFMRDKLLYEMDYAPEGLDDYYVNDEDISHDEHCRRNSWRSKVFTNCNSFHELTIHRDLGRRSLQDYQVTYKGQGSFRTSWLLEHPHWNEEFVIKVLRYRDVFGYQRFHEMRQEAIILERLSASPRIVDIYGFCGATILAEHMHQEITPLIVPGAGVEWLDDGGYIQQSELDRLQEQDVFPMNRDTLSLEQKLDWAIIMAESIAEVHGFVGGAIVHGDIHPVQWLRNRDGNIKLNDFNNGDILQFDVVRNDYCPIYRCYGGPQFRPPEEIDCGDADETIDTYAMGMTMYTLLTGLWPYYQYGKGQDELIEEKLLEEEELPFIDPRYRNHSTIESGLVQIIQGCWMPPGNRSSIFEVVERLHQLRREHYGPRFDQQSQP